MSADKTALEHRQAHSATGCPWLPHCRAELHGLQSPEHFLWLFMESVPSPELSVCSRAGPEFHPHYRHLILQCPKEVGLFSLSENQNSLNFKVTCATFIQTFEYKKQVPGTVLSRGEFSSEQNGYSFCFQGLYIPKGRKAKSSM